MIEYTTALLLILLTFAVMLTNIKLPILGLIVIAVDMVALYPDVLNGGTVIIGYSMANNIATPVLQSFAWIQYAAIISIVFCAMSFSLRVMGRI